MDILLLLLLEEKSSQNPGIQRQNVFSVKSVNTILLAKTYSKLNSKLLLPGPVTIYSMWTPKEACTTIFTQCSWSYFPGSPHEENSAVALQFCGFCKDTWTQGKICRQKERDLSSEWLPVLLRAETVFVPCTYREHRLSKTEALI